MDERELVQQITREILRELQEAGLTDASGQLAETPAAPLPARTRSHTAASPASVPDEAARPLLLLAGRVLANRRVQRELAELGPFAGNLFAGDEERGVPDRFRPALVQGRDEEEMESLLERTSVILMPWVSLPVLSRLVHLQPECPASLLLARALLKGMKVHARKRLIQPELDLYRFHEPSPILRRVQELIRESRQMGLAWAPGDRIGDLLRGVPERIEPGKKRLLTAADVRALKEAGEIVLPGGTIVTPLARDEIKRYGLQIRTDG